MIQAAGRHPARKRREKTPVAAFSDVERKEKAPTVIHLRSLFLDPLPGHLLREQERVQVSQSKASLK